jgi:hypothetical protein
MVFPVLPIIHASLVFALIIIVIRAQLSKVFNAIINPAMIIPYVIVTFAMMVFAFLVMTKKILMPLYAVDYLVIQMFNVVLEHAQINFVFHVILLLAFIVQGQFVKEIMTV